MSKESQATILVGLAESSYAYFFHTPDQTAYAKLDFGDHHEVWEVRRKVFRRWLARLYYGAAGQAPGSQAVQDAIGVLEGKALFEGGEHDVYVRLAHIGDGIYLDLANSKWESVKITAEGWMIAPESEVFFKRPAGMLELPYPERDGSLSELRPFSNVDGAQWPLVVGWLVGAFSRGPYTILDLLGQQGSAKSTTARVLRSLVDPNASPLRAEPREVRDLMIAAGHGWVLGWDNISRIPDWLSDALCRLATGGGFSTRELYSDQEEIIFEARRPVIVNGIEELLTRGDALDRALLVYLDEISDEDRLEEEEFWQAFEAARPRILGALLDAVVGALARRRYVRLESKPRMADFARWVVAAEPDLGLEDGAFMRAYQANRRAANEIALEANQMGAVIGELVEKNGGSWEGSATELLAAINEVASEDLQRLREWPKTATAMGNVVSRLTPNLRSTGLMISRERGGARRRIVLQKLEQGGKGPSLPSQPSPGRSPANEGRDTHDTGDGRGPTQSSYGGA